MNGTELRSSRDFRFLLCGCNREGCPQASVTVAPGTAARGQKARNEVQVSFRHALRRQDLKFGSRLFSPSLWNPAFCAPPEISFLGPGGIRLADVLWHQHIVRAYDLHRMRTTALLPLTRGLAKKEKCPGRLPASSVHSNRRQLWANTKLNAPGRRQPSFIHVNMVRFANLANLWFATWTRRDGKGFALMSEQISLAIPPRAP